MPVRVLFDECLPKKLKRDVWADIVVTVQEMGWSSKKNGELMTLAPQVNHVLLTIKAGDVVQVGE